MTESEPSSSGRRAWGTSALVLLVIAGGCFAFYAWKSSEQTKARDAVLATMPVDFSQPGHFEVEFDHTYGQATQLIAWAEIQRPAEINWLQMKPLLDEVIATLDITDTGGGSVVGGPATVDFGDAQISADRELARVPVDFPTGRYRLVLTVTRGNRTLTGTDQNLTLRYMIYGLEIVPAQIVLAGGMVFLVAGATAAVVCRRASRRAKSRCYQPKGRQ